MLLKFAKIVKRLSSKSETKREEAINELINMEIQVINIEDIDYLIQSSTTVHIDNENHIEDASSVIMEFVARFDVTSFVPALIKAFPTMSIWARSVTLTLLTRIKTEESLQALLFLLEEYIDTIPFMDFHLELTGGEKDCVEILFPQLLDYIEYSEISYTLHRYIWSCLNKGTITQNDIQEEIPVYIREYRFIKAPLEAFQVQLDAPVKMSQTYQELRNTAGLFLDIFGYIEHKEVEKELYDALKLKDNRLKYFATSSLIKQGKKIEQSIINEIAADSEVRNFLYKTLEEHGLEEKFPKEYLNQTSFAESDLVNWLNYPTELAHTPTEIQCMDVITRYDEHLGALEYYVFRFRSEHEEWKEAGWMAGISGYYVKDMEPTIQANNYTFSLFEQWGEKSAEEHLESIFEALDQAWQEE